MGIAERKEREKQLRREEIIQAAEKVFFLKGFDKSTMDEIAEKVELSKGTLYLYFKSKEDLQLAVAHKAILLLNSVTEGIKTMKENALEKLLSLGRACIEFSNNYPNQMKSIMFLEGFELAQISLSAREIREVIYRDSPVGLVVQIVEQGVREQLIRDDIPAPVIAHTLWMQLLSVVQFVTMKPAFLEMLDLSPASIYESHFELVINGIKL